jgi:hypothetical protein
MQRRTMTISISGAVLAILAGIAPNANACSVPGIPALKPAVMLPPGLIAAPGSGSRPAGTAASIVGLWHVKFYSGGTLSDNAFDAWHSDGTEVLNDFTNPIEDNVCLGVWTQTAAGSYKLKHPSWTFDSSGNLTGLAMIFETVTVSTDGNTYSGVYTVDLFDTMGNPVGSFNGGLMGERIMPD